MTFTSTNGAKFQITGPSAPTLVNVQDRSIVTASGSSLVYVYASATRVTAFSTNIAARNSGATATDNLYDQSLAASVAIIDAVIINGANAGTITLQGACNQASGGNTLFKAGSYMRAERIA